MIYAIHQIANIIEVIEDSTGIVVKSFVCHSSADHTRYMEVAERMVVAQTARHRANRMIAAGMMS